MTALILICVDQCEVETTTSSSSQKLDLVFILDSSGSVGSDDFQSMLRSIETIVSSETLRIGPDDTRVAIIRFSTDANLLFNLSRYSDLDSLIQGISEVNFIGGGTNTQSALRLLRESAANGDLGLRDSTSAVPIAIVITDGRSGLPAQEAELLHTSTNFDVFAVGVGSNIDVQELMLIAGSDGFVIQIDSFGPSDFQRFEKQIEIRTCRGMYI